MRLFDPSFCPLIPSLFSVALAASGFYYSTTLSLTAAEPAVPSITAASAIVLDRDSGAVLGAKNPDVRRAMASTTKMMTALIAIERSGAMSMPSIR